jgi:16S rRNA (guanine966-N2)-methyltransferase
VPSTIESLGLLIRPARPARILGRVRVIAGTAKGMRLGRAPAGVRPVSDRVREGLFSSLGPRVEGARVLDLYAGTGAVGIEALSRGAEHATFVDGAPGAVAAVRENLRRTALEGRSEVHRSDVLRFLQRTSGELRGFDVVFLDPPYDSGPAELDPVLDHLSESSLLREGFTVVLSRGSRSSNHVIPLHWHVARRLSYGDSVVTLFRSPGTPSSPGGPGT